MNGGQSMTGAILPQAIARMGGCSGGMQVSQVARVVNRLEDVPVRVPDLRPKRTTAPNEAGSWSSKEEEQKTLRK